MGQVIELFPTPPVTITDDLGEAALRAEIRRYACGVISILAPSPTNASLDAAINISSNIVILLKALRAQRHLKGIKDQADEIAKWADALLKAETLK